LVIGHAANHPRRVRCHDGAQRLRADGTVHLGRGKPSTCCRSSALRRVPAFTPKSKVLRSTPAGRESPPQCVPVERAVHRCRGLSGYVSHLNGAKCRVVIPVPQGAPPGSAGSSP
jgi:hypothetical protein